MECDNHATRTCRYRNKCGGSVANVHGTRQRCADSTVAPSKSPSARDFRRFVHSRIASVLRRWAMMGKLIPRQRPLTLMNKPTIPYFVRGRHLRRLPDHVLDEQEGPRISNGPATVCSHWFLVLAPRCDESAFFRKFSIYIAIIALSHFTQTYIVRLYEIDLLPCDANGVSELGRWFTSPTCIPPRRHRRSRASLGCHLQQSDHDFTRLSTGCRHFLGTRRGRVTRCQWLAGFDECNQHRRCSS